MPFRPGAPAALPGVWTARGLAPGRLPARVDARGHDRANPSRQVDAARSLGFGAAARARRNPGDVAEARDRSGVFTRKSTSLLNVVTYVHPQLRVWLDSHNRVRAELDARL